VFFGRATRYVEGHRQLRRLTLSVLCAFGERNVSLNGRRRRHNNNKEDIYKVSI